MSVESASLNVSPIGMPPSFVTPAYGSRCFSDLPLLTHSLLAGNPGAINHLDPSLRFDEQYDFVILLFIDGFGWRFFEKFADHPFLQNFVGKGGKYSGNHNGQAAKWTSQFPSTTAAHVTAIHTGLPVGQSGIYEWIYYEPQVDAVIAPLLYSYAGSKERDTLMSAEIAPASIYPSSTTHYERLKADGIQSTILQHIEYTPSTYSDVVFKGANVVPYRTLPEALTNLRLLLDESVTPHYFFLYFDKVDTHCHEYGPNSPQVEAEIDFVLTSLERLLLNKLTQFSPTGQSKNGLLMVTADHGMAEVDPATTMYLNLESQFASILPLFKQNRQGAPIVPAGCGRDMFLYIQDNYLDEVQAKLSHELSDMAAVVKTADLLNHGYFGPPPFSPALDARLGNLVILPYLHESVWWYEQGKFSMDQYGHHGGLTPEEAHIPLLTLELSL